MKIINFFSIPFLIFFLLSLAQPSYAVNYYSADLESSSSQSLSITDANQSGLDLTGNSSFSFYVKPESLPSSGQEAYFLSKWNTTGNQRSFALGLYNNSGTQKLTLVISNDGSNTQFKEYAYTLATSTWTRLTYVYDASAGTCSVYINGAYETQWTGLYNSIFNSTGSFFIGSLNLINYYDGLIDEVLITNDLLSATEISDFDDCGITDQVSNIVAFWKLDNNGTDQTVNNNDLTNNNSVTFQSASLPFTIDCTIEEEETPTATTTTILPQDLRAYNDISIISGYIEHYTTSTTTPSEIEHWIFHIPFLLWIVVCIPVFFIAYRITIELIIRFRK